MKQQTSRAWFTFAIIFLSGIVMMMGQFKVPPLMSGLLTYFSTDPATGGWLMSSFSIAGIVLGIPAALILRRIGTRACGTLALACAVVGSLLGLLATPDSIAVLLAARVVEGVGVAIIGVVAPTAIASLFGLEKRGLPLGIWSTWIATGMLCIYPVAVPVREAFGSWKAVWCMSAALSAVACVLFFLFVKVPGEVRESHKASAGASAASARTSGAFHLSLPLVALAVSYVCFSAAMSSFNTYAPSYIEIGLGLTARDASALSTFISAGALVGGLVAGTIVQKTQAPAWVMRGGLVAYGIIFVWAFDFTLEAAIAELFMVGFIKVFCPTAVYDLAPRMLPPEDAGMAMGIVSVAQNVGMAVGAPLVGAAVGSLADPNWGLASAALVAMCALGLVAMIPVRKKRAATAVSASATDQESVKVSETAA